MKKFETWLRIIMTLEKVRRKKKSQGKAWQPIDRVEPPRPPRLHRIRGQRDVLRTLGDPWSVPQPPGPSFPAYGYPPTANRWHLYSVRFLLTSQEASGQFFPGSRTGH